MSFKSWWSHSTSNFCPAMKICMQNHLLIITSQQSTHQLQHNWIPCSTLLNKTNLPKCHVWVKLFLSITAQLQQLSTFTTSKLTNKGNKLQVSANYQNAMSSSHHVAQDLTNHRISTCAVDKKQLNGNVVQLDMYWYRKRLADCLPISTTCHLISKTCKLKLISSQWWKQSQCPAGHDLHMNLNYKLQKGHYYIITSMIL